MRDLPKVDLDLSLLGAVPPAMMRDLAARRRIDIAGAFARDGSYVFAKEMGFARLYATLASLPARPEDYARLLAAVLEQSAEGGVIYCEIGLEPGIVAGGDLSAWRESVAAMAEVAGRAAPQIQSRLVPACLRAQGPGVARRAALCAAETAGDFVTGFALAGGDGPAGTREYLWAFDCAREAGLGLSAQIRRDDAVGEIDSVIRALGLRRVRGALQAISDIAFVEDLAERGITLELTPAGDIALGHCPGWRQHPSGPLYQRDGRIALCSGANAVFDTPMPRLVERLHQAFDWDEGVFTRLAQTALEAAFCDPASREALLQRLAKPG
jgi:adenosine deaminase